ncbi:MAG: beta-glycosidase, partial [Sphingobacteriaceae bacterium]
MIKSIMLFLIGLFLINSTGFSQTLVFTINTKHKAQTIDNFGASGAWFSEGIGKYWPAEKKERMVELLFTKA